MRWPSRPEDMNERLAAAFVALVLGGLFFIAASSVFGDHGWVGLLAAAAAVLMTPRSW